MRPNPVKKADTRTPAYVFSYGSECWELDALPPDELRKIVKGAIEGYIDPGAWNEKIEEIRKERELLKKKMGSLKKEIANFDFKI